PVYSLRPLLWIFISNSATTGHRSFPVSRANRSLLAPMERSLSRRRALDGSGETLTHHLEGFNLCADRRDCRRRHNFAACTPGRRKELGLSLLLAARRHFHALGLY